MSTSLLYRAFGIRGDDYVRTEYRDGQVICEVLRREAEADFLDRDFPADPFAR